MTTDSSAFDDEVMAAPSPNTNNYFKLEHRFFFFNDLDVRSVQSAHTRAEQALSEMPKSLLSIRKSRISVFRRPRVSGPWAFMHVVGEFN